MVVRNAFDGIFRIGSGRRLALAHIDLPGLQDFPYFIFINMPAGHPAAGMFGQDETGICPVKRVVGPGGSDPVSLQNKKDGQ
jgi:hypothetical protein